MCGVKKPLTGDGWVALTAAQWLEEHRIMTRLVLDVDWNAKIGEILVCN